MERLSRICLALPETSRVDHNQHAQFLVRRKTFAYFLNDHHGDKIISVTCKVLPGDNTALVRSDPTRFYLPAYLAARGWVALRLDLGEIDWEEVAELVAGSFRLVAPAKLRADLSDRGSVDTGKVVK